MNSNSLSDQELIKGYLSGNHSNLTVIIDRHQKRIFGYIYMIVKDKFLADDIFQDTFVKVVNKLRSGKYNEEGKFLQWVMRIAHNLIIDHFRKSKRIPTIENSDEFNIFDTIKVYDKPFEESIITEQTHEKLRKLIELLPEEQREVLKMRHYKEMSFKDIAAHSNVSINTALGRMRYALINLRKMIEEKNLMLAQ